jgi:L-lactate dehydrogenase complex protein LldG
VCPGTFGVAENGAVWIADSVVPEPALLFLTQHLVLMLDRRQIVSNMHEAYERLSFDERSYGTFISGPSKTADIEQSLVIGAHGPRSVTVLLLAADP